MKGNIGVDTTQLTNDKHSNLYKIYNALHFKQLCKFPLLEVQQYA